ncbi:RNA-guided pseudouridylation complex pseudouridine synthase subunit Cbf5 [Candidatus Pacearchaeota archaeon]|nr:RNA-guided pseudouridylation complex pseudouridine synthase subunit Cbf5 [Candidatus Pacearchaeota archaeon]
MNSKNTNLETIKSKKTLKELLEFSIINIDKPSGPTSFSVDLIIKNALNLKKASHFGTLDPMVTGVLPVALSRACRLMPYFIGKTKTYIGIMRIHEEISEKKLNEEIKNFIGKITQLPPVKSRVKREERQREIYRFEILEVSENKKDILFLAEVEAGTYIRKLVSDLGEKIQGAHMLELRRIQASLFKEAESYTIYEFLKAVEEYKKAKNEEPLREMLIPGEIISKVLPIFQVKKQYINKLYHGSPLFKEYIDNLEKAKEVNLDEKIAVFSEDKFIGTFKIVKSERILANPEFILQPIK